MRQLSFFIVVLVLILPLIGFAQESGLVSYVEDFSKTDQDIKSGGTQI